MKRKLQTIALSVALVMLCLPPVFCANGKGGRRSQSLSLSADSSTKSARNDPDDETLFKRVAALLQSKCIACHNDEQPDGGLSLQTQKQFLNGGSSGPILDTDDPESSYLLEMIAVENGQAEMPKDGDPMSEAQLKVVADWINAGAPWPKAHKIDLKPALNLDWWSLKPLRRPAIPKLIRSNHTQAHPIDQFIRAKQRELGLAQSNPAEKRVLIRRLYFDLLGLPPTPEAIETFVNDTNPKAYENLVEKLLDSPHYGERWARHWLDLVQYADTHGYDKDKIRENAWPYRDYVIQSFNQDKNYSRFVQEQIAGDVRFGHTVHGQVATGFLAAGPWDFIGHVEVPETKIDGKIARMLDRDDMVSTTMNTFVSTTVQCARCHHHKFDPIHQEHYYALHSVFAALDRADKSYDKSDEVAKQRAELKRKLAAAEKRLRGTLGREDYELLQRLLANPNGGNVDLEFGWHSEIHMSQDSQVWVQIDLGQPKEFSEVALMPAYDDFNNIGAGFGFPLRFKIETSNDPEFKNNVSILHDQTNEDLENPGIESVRFKAIGILEARYVRVTATKLFKRKSDFIFALGELEAGDGLHSLPAKSVSSSSTINAKPRWHEQNLIDKKNAISAYSVKRLVAWLTTVKDPANKSPASDYPLLLEQAKKELEGEKSKSLKAIIARKVYEKVEEYKEQIKKLEVQSSVFSATNYMGNGNFSGRVGLGPREIRVLKRGDVRSPGELAVPGTIPMIKDLDWKFANCKNEGERRVALAKWLVRNDNPLTWRSIVNRIWHYHFGQGIVATPNDFGRMGAKPTHPKLLDWLAVEFRDGGHWIRRAQSIKDLHRLIVTSDTYKQSSSIRQEFAKVDKDNRYLWRMNRIQLDAESIRDSMLQVSGMLDRKMYGQPFRNFVVEKPEHSPHYVYEKFDPTDRVSHRRSIYRFVVRSQQQPLMNSLNCADPNQRVAVRNQSNTVCQSLAMMNNKFVLAMSKYFANRLENESPSKIKQILIGFELITGRKPSNKEAAAIIEYRQNHSLPETCRVLFNLNEFVFVD